MTPVVQYGDDTLFYYDEETGNIVLMRFTKYNMYASWVIEWYRFPTNELGRYFAEGFESLCEPEKVENYLEWIEERFSFVSPQVFVR